MSQIDRNTIINISNNSSDVPEIAKLRPSITNDLLSPLISIDDLSQQNNTTDPYSDFVAGENELSNKHCNDWAIVESHSCPIYNYCNGDDNAVYVVKKSELAAGIDTLGRPVDISDLLSNFDASQYGNELSEDTKDINSAKKAIMIFSNNNKDKGNMINKNNNRKETLAELKDNIIHYTPIKDLSADIEQQNKIHNQDDSINITTCDSESSQIKNNNLMNEKQSHIVSRPNSSLEDEISGEFTSKPSCSQHENELPRSDHAANNPTVIARQATKPKLNSTNDKKPNIYIQFERDLPPVYTANPVSYVQTTDHIYSSRENSKRWKRKLAALVDEFGVKPECLVVTLNVKTGKRKYSINSEKRGESIYRGNISLSRISSTHK